jgi:hypothetical protein
VQSAPDGPGLGFAGLALIPFHDPTTIKPLVNRALGRRTSPATRWCFLNAAPYVLSMGDAFFEGQGALDREAREYARAVMSLADMAALKGLGRSHAAQLREMFEASKKDAAKDSDIGLAIWHESAYLIGTLDPRDHETLAPLFDPDDKNVFANLMSALSFAANHDFLAELQATEPSQITRDLENKAAKEALDWWKRYTRQNPGGDWLPAIIAGFRETGYELEDNLQSEKSIRAILRAMDSKSEVTRYNACRLLNHAFKAHFDLERIFFSDKYALSFLEPMAEKGRSEERLKKYWKERLKS